MEAECSPLRAFLVNTTTVCVGDSIDVEFVDAAKGSLCAGRDVDHKLTEIVQSAKASTIAHTRGIITGSVVNIVAKLGNTCCVMFSLGDEQFTSTWVEKGARSLVEQPLQTHDLALEGRDFVLCKFQHDSKKNQHLGLNPSCSILLYPH